MIIARFKYQLKKFGSSFFYFIHIRINILIKLAFLCLSDIIKL
jgi:hypothetical protein